MALKKNDMNLLWSRASGLCSAPECKKNLIRFSKSSDGFYSIGEMAHMKAKSIKGPRGTGPMSARARDSYKNHILLCPFCHTDIDKNPDDFPIKVLREFKRQHEHWVAETLRSNFGQKISFLGFYEDILQKIERYFDFSQWAWLIDGLWRDMAPAFVIENINTLRTLILKTQWPGSLPKLEKSFKAVLQSWSDYVENFEKNCEYKQGNADYLVSDHIQREMPLAQKMKAEVAEEEWSRTNGINLINFVFALNNMMNAVREELIPIYRQKEGSFVIDDHLGFRNNGVPIIIRPDKKIKK